jgi:hypothetical protein
MKQQLTVSEKQLNFEARIWENEWNEIFMFCGFSNKSSADNEDEAFAIF